MSITKKWLQTVVLVVVIGALSAVVFASSAFGATLKNRVLCNGSGSCMARGAGACYGLSQGRGQCQGNGTCTVRGNGTPCNNGGGCAMGSGTCAAPQN